MKTKQEQIEEKRKNGIYLKVATRFALPMALVALVPSLIGIYLLQQNLDEIKQDRRERINFVAQSAFENCARNNFQDHRDRSQDQTLKKLVDAALGEAETDFRTEAKAAQRILNARLDQHPPDLETLKTKWARGPGLRDCHGLPTEGQARGEG